MLRVLYLANYAPVLHGNIEQQIVDGTQPDYHEKIFAQLSDFGFDVVSTRDVEVLVNNPKDFDYVFSLLNRAPYRGSEVFISALCEFLGLPYLGARPHVRAIGEDKYFAKIIAKNLGFKVPASYICSRSSYLKSYPPFSGPYIAKPRYGATSRDLTEDCIQDMWEDLVPEIERLLLLCDEVLVEEFISGTNVSLPILGAPVPNILPAYCLWSAKKGELITYNQKRNIEKDTVRSILDDPKRYEYIRDLSATLYREMEPIDYLRVDFRMTDEGEFWFLEFNICCNIGPQSGFYFCAHHVGISHSEMIKLILMHSFGRQEVTWKAFEGI